MPDQILQEGFPGGHTHAVGHVEDPVFQELPAGQFPLQPRGQSADFRRGHLDPAPEEKGCAQGESHQDQGPQARLGDPAGQGPVLRGAQPAVDGLVVIRGRILPSLRQVAIQGGEEIAVLPLRGAEEDVEGTEHDRGPLHAVLRFMGVAEGVDRYACVHLTRGHRREHIRHVAEFLEGAGEVELGAEFAEMLAVDVPQHHTDPAPPDVQDVLDVGAWVGVEDAPHGEGGHLPEIQVGLTIQGVGHAGEQIDVTASSPVEAFVPGPRDKLEFPMFPGRHGPDDVHQEALGLPIAVHECGGGVGEDAHPHRPGWCRAQARKDEQEHRRGQEAARQDGPGGGGGGHAGVLVSLAVGATKLVRGNLLSDQSTAPSSKRL